jgi:hypothetical protein
MEFNQTFKEKLTPILLNVFHIIEMAERENKNQELTVSSTL